MFTETKEFQHLDKIYPHITKKIMLNWGSSDLNEYLSDLLIENRNGERKGFPNYDFQCIQYIMDIHVSNFLNLINIEQ